MRNHEKGYEQKKGELGAVVTMIFVEDTGELVMVEDPTKPQPIYTKCAGGGIKEEDIDPNYPNDVEITADNASLREGREETGLKNLRIACRLTPVVKRTHTQYARLATVRNTNGIAQFGNDGEIVRVYSRAEFLARKDFMPSYESFLREGLAYIDENYS